ncbi:MAG: carboxypeptidase-like regulatory domain-containing protein [Fimbriimonadales bacterium]
MSSGFARWPGAVALLVVCGLAASAGVSEESASPNAFPAIHGQAVDDATLAALPGVAILAFWTGPDAVLLHYSQTLRVVEVTTGAEGGFLVPASEPVAAQIPVGRVSPNLLCFKPGYKPEWLNEVGTVLVGKPVTIRLQKSDGMPAAKQSEILAGLTVNLAWVAATRDGQPPGIFAAMEAEWTRLQGGLPPSERTGTTLRAAFAWWVEEFRRANRERGTRP